MKKTSLKNIISLCLILTLLGSLLAACGGKGDVTADSDTDVTDEVAEEDTNDDLSNEKNDDAPPTDKNILGIGENDYDNLFNVGKWENDMLNEEQHNYDSYVNYRAMLKNTYKKLNEDKKLNVVYFGGSVTSGYGASDNETYSWRAKIGKWLKNSFPDAEINNINRALGESGTYLGCYRTPADVIGANPDLLFIEYSINDLYYKSSYEAAASQFETIVREVKTALPSTDIVVLLVTDKNCLETNKQGKLHTQAQAHEDIAKAYNITTLHVGRYLANVVEYNASKWSNYAIDGVHLNDAGYNEYYKVVREFMNNALIYTDYTVTQQEFVMSEQVSDTLFDGNRTNIQPTEQILVQSEALGGQGVTYSSASSFSSAAISDSKGRLVFDSTSDELVLTFSGTEICAYSFQKSANLLVSIDGGDYVTVSGTGHNPVILANGLSSGTHTIKIKLKDAGSVTIGSIFTRDATIATTKSA